MPQTAPRRIAVIGGGANDEHTVSLASAAAVARAVRELNLVAVPLTVSENGIWRDETGTALPAHAAVRILTGCDIAFPVLHGVHGEDGAIAGMLDLCGVPCAGSPVRAGALGMDKHVTKLIAESLGIATARSRIVLPGRRATETSCGVPLVVKPTAGGSSNGVFVVTDPDSLVDAVEQARCFGDTVLIEEYVVGREIDIAVFRDGTGALRLGAPLEIGVSAGGVFGVAEKYDGSAQFTVPAPLDDGESEAIQEAAIRMYDALGCSGVARFDFFLTESGPILNEVNTSPGMTEQSQVPRMYAAIGLDYAALIRDLLAACVSAATADFADPGGSARRTVWDPRIIWPFRRDRTYGLQVPDIRPPKPDVIPRQAPRAPTA